MAFLKSKVLSYCS